uniref:Rho GTPase-activating protein 20 n=1 Tax=Hirondellea gigas TaxID=1518452 RepID=A0A6A7FQI8_9CRUS
MTVDKMLCSSDDLCGTGVGCTPLFCVPSRGMNDTFEAAPAYATKSYMTPQRMQQLKKRQSKQQTFVRCKNTKLDNDCSNVAMNVDDEYMSDVVNSTASNSLEDSQLSCSNVTTSSQISNNSMQRFSGILRPKFTLVQQTTTESSALFCSSTNRCDTMKLSKARRMKTSASKLQKRRTLMENHFGSESSNQSRTAFVRGNIDGIGLQTPRCAIYRSSSTACISPVRKTSSVIPDPAVYYRKSSSDVNETRVNPGLVLYENLPGRSSVGCVSHSNVNDARLQLPSAENLHSQHYAIRQRSKSFSNREVLRELSLSKVEPQHVSALDVNRLSANDMKHHFASGTLSNGTTCSPESSSSSSSSNSTISIGSSGSPTYSNNINNTNILSEESKNSEPHCVKKKLKAAKKKLKGTKMISKSLHSIFPIGCTGSLTLQHDPALTDKKSGPIYQSINKTETQYQAVHHQQTPYHATDNKSNSFHTPIPNRQSSTNTPLHVIKSYTKRKPSKPEPLQIFHPNTNVSSKSVSSTSINKNNNKTSNGKHNLGKTKSLKSLSKNNFLSCVATKDLWYNKLAQVIAEEKESTPPSMTIQVSFYDTNTGADICKTVSITSNTNARDCITLILDHLEMRDVDVTKFQLWVKSSQEDSPYPLIGHEFPFAIKYNSLRESIQDCDAEQCNNLYNSSDVKCQFILRQQRKVGLNGLSPENGGKKVSKKARKSPLRIKEVFKRSNSKGDTVDGPASAPPGILFGHTLEKLIADTGAIPKPILEMLSELFQKGPFTVGIFRKSANVRLVKELREKLDSGCPTDLSSTNITAVAAILKEFLRSLPDALLCSDLYDAWLEIPQLPTDRDQISRTLLLCSRLPRANLLLLQHFLCVLHHIARRSSLNMMTPSNLAVCVGPSLLWPADQSVAFCTETSKQAPSVMEFLIERFGEVFGEAMLRLMGEPPEHDPARQDSGAEESDSLHSGHSLHSGRRDDSSIDSLERDLEGELSPLPRKDKMSLTNLSRDSGLTMSDTQLYTPDEEESESTSSGHSSGDKNMSYPDPRPAERVQHYPAPNNPNAIYTAVCRRPEKNNAYEEPENYYATPSREHTRVHITYSTPSYPSSKDYNTHLYNQDFIHDDPMTYENDVIYSVPSNEHSFSEQEHNRSNFQRDNWMRRKSNLRRISKIVASGEGGLTRSTSEESLLSKYNTHEYGMSLGAGGAAGPRSPSEERTRSPATIEYDDSVSFITRDSAIRRSRSAHYLAEVRREKLKDKSDVPSSITRSSSQDTVSWLRSRSTPHMPDEGDRSYDSSTLSDDDSTPHVSRSNSRGKECGTSGSASWDATLTPSDSGNSRNSSFKSERTGSVCTVVSAGSCSTLNSNPPSYEEALNRRSIMQQQQQRTATPPQFNDYAIREEKVKSARAKKLYADSLRLYQEEKVYGDIVRASPAHAHDVDELDCPPPLPPKGDPPPLPPKQRSSRRGINGDTASRLKHLPPVHVETQCRKQKLSNTSSTSSTYGTTMHKTIIYTDAGPPNLPPKERTVIEVVESTSETDRVRQQTVQTFSPQVVEKKSIETQTDDCDLDDEDLSSRDEDCQTSDSWMSEHITSVHVPDSSYNSTHNHNGAINNDKRSRGRLRRRDSSTSQRSRSVPSRDVVHSVSNSDDEDDCYVTSHEYPNTSNYGLRDFRNLEPELRDEISWSVSQLRSIFGESLNGAKIHPPPYRPPPSAGRAPITSYHLGVGDAYSRKSRPQSSYGEESYV